MTDITPLLQAVQSFGNWILFFWLFVQQSAKTDKLHEQHKSDLRKAANIPASDNHDD